MYMELTLRWKISRVTLDGRLQVSCYGFHGIDVYLVPLPGTDSGLCLLSAERSTESIPSLDILRDSNRRGLDAF